METGNMKLDGGAMFGVVPKSLWQKEYPADENNMCNIASRSMFVITGTKKILIDTGVGNKQDEKFLGHYYLNGEATLEDSLKKLGYRSEDITDVIHTHLHFDHCGGSVVYDNRGKLIPAFPNATYHVSRLHWDLANDPNRREKASFLDENIRPLEENGKLNLIEKEGELMPGINIRFYKGHTEGQVVPFIQHENTIIVFVGDLMPLMANIPIAWVCGYDTRPLDSLKEKEAFLNEAYENNYILYFQHDIFNECCMLEKSSRGLRPGKKFPLRDLFE